MPDYPSGLVNLNFGMHGCIHLGTQLPAQVNFFSGVGSFYCSKMVVDVVLVKNPGKNDVYNYDTDGHIVSRGAALANGAWQGSTDQVTTPCSRPFVDVDNDDDRDLMMRCWRYWQAFSCIFNLSLLQIFSNVKPTLRLIMSTDSGLSPYQIQLPCPN